MPIHRPQNRRIRIVASLPHNVEELDVIDYIAQALQHYVEQLPEGHTMKEGVKAHKIKVLNTWYEIDEQGQIKVFHWPQED